MAYSDIPMQIQPDIIRHIQNPVKPNIFRTLVYSELWQIQNHRHMQSLSIFRTLASSEPEPYWELWYIQNPRIFRTLGCFVKIVNIFYEKNIMNSLNICVTFTPIVFIPCKKIWRPRERGRWILIYPKTARNFKQILICSETKTF